MHGCAGWFSAMDSSIEPAQLHMLEAERISSEVRSHVTRTGGDRVLVGVQRLEGHRAVHEDGDWWDLRRVAEPFEQMEHDLGAVDGECGDEHASAMGDRLCDDASETCGLVTGMRPAAIRRLDDHDIRRRTPGGPEQQRV